MKKTRIVLLILLLLVALGMAGYNIFVEKAFDAKDIGKFVLLVCSILVALLRPSRSRPIGNK
jgi:hypothetical protein